MPAISMFYGILILMYFYNNKKHNCPHIPRIHLRNVRHTRTMKFFTLLILVLVACAGCQTPPAAPSAAEWRQKLRTVNLADGVSESEAQIIGGCYFAEYVGCGGFAGIRDGGDCWIVDGSFGFVGIPVQGFFIDKHSGKLVSPIGPSYNNPLEIYP